MSLQDSLGGGAKTVFLATVSPGVVDKDETLSTLKYANFLSLIVRKESDEVAQAKAAAATKVSE